jgi:hypothetical protein
MALMGFWRRGSSGRTRLVTGTGKAIVLSDLHGHHGDWLKFLEVSNALARIRDGEDLWLVITGDAPDVARHRSVDPDVPEDGDVRILDELIRAHDELGERAERIIYLEGNHDFHLSRLWREVDRWHVFERGKARAPEGQVPVNTPEEIEAYFEHYRSAYGPAIFANNIAPYDMVHRLRPDHVRFLERSPVLAHLPDAGVIVTHAGPTRMGGWRPGPLRRAVDACDREWMRTAAPDAYYRSAYHQLLNNRFRNGDYTLDDVARFLACWDEAGLMITGHTPHPYLVDFDRRAPLEGCAFRDGLGCVGPHQVVLCSSFGAFTPGLKRYVELDLSRRYRTVDDLFEAGCVRAVRPDAPSAHPDEVPGLDVALGLVSDPTDPADPSPEDPTPD